MSNYYLRLMNVQTGWDLRNEASRRDPRGYVAVAGPVGVVVASAHAVTRVPCAERVRWIFTAQRLPWLSAVH